MGVCTQLLLLFSNIIIEPDIYALIRMCELVHFVLTLILLIINDVQFT